MAVTIDVNKLSDQLGTALKPLADKIGDGADHLYAIAVKDAYISGIEAWVYTGIAFILFWTGIYMAGKFRGMANAYLTKKKSGYYSSDVSPYYTGICLSYIVSFISFWATTAWFSNAIHYTMNPEYMALKELLKAVTQTH